MAEYKRKKRPSRGRRKRRRQRNRRLLITLLCIGGIILIACLGFFIVQRARAKEEARKASLMDPLAGAPPLDVELLTPNEYSRPELALEEVKNVAIHYTANPGSTAMDNRNYFENLKESHETKASSHFIVGLEGEIVQCIPTAEMSYATNERNVDTLSIECCHPDETGQFTDATYQSVVHLTAWLCSRFSLDPSKNVIRHYDVTGKECPRYYVQNPEAWEQMKKDIQKQMKTISRTS